MNPMNDCWSVFGRDQGQIVEYAYRYHEPTDSIVCRRTDRCDNSVTYEMAPCPDDLTWNGSEDMVDMSVLDWSASSNPFAD